MFSKLVGQWWSSRTPTNDSHFVEANERGWIFMFVFLETNKRIKWISRLEQSRRKVTIKPIGWNATKTREGERKTRKTLKKWARNSRTANKINILQWTPSERVRWRIAVIIRALLAKSLCLRCLSPLCNAGKTFRQTLHLKSSISIHFVSFASGREWTKEGKHERQKERKKKT